MVQLPFQQVRSLRGYNPMCIHCGQETSNPKFCSRSCSASYNNTRTPRRQPKERFCERCQESMGGIRHGRRIWVCEDCKLRRPTQSYTLGELKAAKKGWRQAIHTDSRNRFIKSGRALKCNVCSYDVVSPHVCHIRDIRDLDHTQPA